MSLLRVSPWGATFKGRRFACSIGKTGVTTTKAEGDGATPSGQFRIMGGGYRPDRIPHPFFGRRGPFHLHRISPRDLWSDDPNDAAYNHAVHDPDHPFSAESLRRADPLYDLFLILDYNWPNAVPGKGSAIFMHIWRKPRHPTEGCVAFARDDLLWIVQNWTPQCRVHIPPEI